MADPSPFGDTFLRDIVRAISEDEPVNVRLGGCVESVVTRLTHRRFCREVDMGPPPLAYA